MRITPLTLAIAAALSTVLLPTTPPSHAAAPAYLCPHNNTLIAPGKFPMTWKLGDSKQYKNGARTCSWSHHGTITYRCKGQSLTSINVVGNGNGKRHRFTAICDQRDHTISAKSAYAGLRGPFHAHWHTGELRYQNGVLRVSA